MAIEPSPRSCYAGGAGHPWRLAPGSVACSLFDSQLTCSGSSSSSDGFTGNSALQGGGAYLAGSTTTLTSVVCDWGAEGGADDNTPYDIHLDSGGSTYDYAADETFTCDTSSCQ